MQGAYLLYWVLPCTPKLKQVSSYPAGYQSYICLTESVEFVDINGERGAGLVCKAFWSEQAIFCPVEKGKNLRDRGIGRGIIKLCREEKRDHGRNSRLAWDMWGKLCGGS